MALRSSEAAPARRRLVLAAALACGGAAAAAPVTLECPEAEGTPGFALSYEAEALSVTDATGTATLAAWIEASTPGIFTIRASGPMQASMPEPAALDACLAAGLERYGSTAADLDMLAYVANGCRLKLAPEATPQPIEAKFEIVSLDPGEATVFVQRRYLEPSAVTGAQVQLDEFPLRNCTVLAGP